MPILQFSLDPSVAITDPAVIPKDAVKATYFKRDNAFERLDVVLGEYRRDDLAMRHYREGTIQKEDFLPVARRLSEWALANSALRAEVEEFARQSENNATPSRLSLDFREEAARYLGDLPWEALLGGDDIPIATRRVSPVRSRGVADGSGAPVPTGSSPLLRVLIVRAGPDDQEPIPEVLRLVDRIRASRAGVRLGIDVLTRESKVPPTPDEPASKETEPAAWPLRWIRGARKGLVALSPTRPAGQPDWETVQKFLNDHQYDIFIFLGHGFEDERGGFGLIFEEPAPPEDGRDRRDSGRRYSDRKSADDLTGLFSTRPVPVVLLIGCQTGAIPDRRAQERLVEHIRGSMGVAERLIETRTRVKCVVGIQQNLSGTLAIRFLERFFGELLHGRWPGHLEAAVWGGRQAIQGEETYPSAYTAPVVLSRLPLEPIFRIRRWSPRLIAAGLIALVFLFFGAAWAIGSYFPADFRTIDEALVSLASHSTNPRSLVDFADAHRGCPVQWEGIIHSFNADNRSCFIRTPNKNIYDIVEKKIRRMPDIEFLLGSDRDVQILGGLPTELQVLKSRHDYTDERPLITLAGTFKLVPGNRLCFADAKIVRYDAKQTASDFFVPMGRSFEDALDWVEDALNNLGLAEREFRSNFEDHFIFPLPWRVNWNGVLSGPITQGANKWCTLKPTSKRYSGYFVRKGVYQTYPAAEFYFNVGVLNIPDHHFDERHPIVTIEGTITGISTRGFILCNSALIDCPD